MGNQQSTSNAVMDVVNTATTNVLMQNSSKCGQSNSQSQSIDISNIDTSGTSCSINVNGISQKAVQTPSFSCLSDSSQSADLQSQLQSAIKQQADAAVSGLSGALNSQAVSNATTKLQNVVNTNLNISNISSCVQDNLQNQDFKLHFLKSGCPGYCSTGCPKDYTCDMSKCSVNIGNISQTATQGAVATCTSKNSALASAVTSISNDLSQSATTKNTGIDFGSSMASLGSFLVPFIISIVILIIISLGCSIIKEV